MSQPAPMEHHEHSALPPRAYLFVPADSERKLTKAVTSGAEALILDLEDSVAQSQRAFARQLLHQYLSEASAAQRKAQQLWVRINPLPSNLDAHSAQAPAALIDLAAVVSARPDGIVLPKCSGPEDILRLHHYLSALEAQAGLPLAHIRILPVATETPQAVLQLPEYTKTALPRLYGMTWGAEDLSSAIGAVSNKTLQGVYADEYRLARALCLMACKASQCWAFGVVYPNFKDLEGLKEEAEMERRTGFIGKIAIHPAQVEVINEAFLPNVDEVAYAQQVIEIFAKNDNAGTVALNGSMLDRPHLKQAQQVLAMAKRG